jgi:hypothetical protein
MMYRNQPTGKITEIVPITWRLTTKFAWNLPLSYRTQSSIILMENAFRSRRLRNPGRVIRRLHEAAQSSIRGPYAATAERPSLAAILSVHGYSPPEHLKYMVAGPIKRSTRRRIKHFGT